MIESDGQAVDLFGGPGGWAQALKMRGRWEVGVELDPFACATRRAAGHAVIRADVSQLEPVRFRGFAGVIGSPPCQGFSSAGKGAARDLIPDLLDSIHSRRWGDRADADPRVWLIVDLGRWLAELAPAWFALEQVPSVLPIWRAYAALLSSRGYSTWAGTLNAADFGVPQTRERAILIAHRDRMVHPPEPTHGENPEPGLFGTLKPWVTMGQALGWSGSVGFPRLDDRGDSPDGYRERDWRSTDQPAFAVTEKARSWTCRGEPLGDGVVDTGRAWGQRSGGAQRVDGNVMPAPAVTSRAGGQWQIGGTRRLSIGDALALQSFPPDYPVRGGRSKQFEQIGNAIPPLLAGAILDVLL